MRRATVSLMFNFRAYVVKIFNEVFGGGGRRDKSEIGPPVNGTIDKLVTLSTDGGRTAGEAYMAAIIIGMVRLISSLLLAQLLTRWVEAVIQRSSNLPLLPDQMLLPDQIQKLLQDSEASVNTGAPANEEASALSEAPVPTGALL